MTKEQIAAIRGYWRQGAKAREIADATGYSYEKIKKLISKFEGEVILKKMFEI